MTRILYWNIENFSDNKIDSPDDPTDSSDRREYILTLFNTHVPDIFVIVEISAETEPVGEQGTLDGAGGGQGALLLLTLIRNRHGQQWCLVPPLTSGLGGVRETIAVYYNPQQVQFVGPYIWAEDRTSVRRAFFNRGMPRILTPGNTVLAPQNYPAQWAAGLPAQGVVPALPNGYPPLPTTGVPLNQVAGQWFWPVNPQNNSPSINAGINFPNENSRKPFLTQFYDTSTNPPRLIRLFSVHTTPTSGKRGRGDDDDYVVGTDTQTAVRRFSQMDPLQLPAQNYTVDVLLGDFNIDSFTAFAMPFYDNPYSLLIANEPGYSICGLTMQFPPYPDPYNPPTRVDPPNTALIPYRLTHLLSKNDATPFNNANGVTDATHNVYPRYGYMGDNGAIDNIFTRYGANSGGPAANATIINTVVGNPYAPPGVGLSYGTTLNNPIPYGGIPDTNNQASQNSKDQFQIWANFGLIRSVSDHLPLIIEV